VAPPTVPPMATPADLPAGDGREDVDFLLGTLRVAARRLTDPLDPDPLGIAVP
jgi:hypothetical protein